MPLFVVTAVWILTCLSSTYLCFVKPMSASFRQVTQPWLLSEGPHWDTATETLYYVDIAGHAVHRYNPAHNTDISIKLNSTVSVVVPIQGTTDQFLIGLGTSLAILTWDGSSTQYSVKTLQTVDSDKPGNRFNDGKADARGRLWIGTMGKEKPVGHVKLRQGTLYRWNFERCALEPVVPAVSISNGLAWPKDHASMYYIDTPTRRIDVFDYDLANGHISNRRTAFDFAAAGVMGNPDGMTIDKDDNLWVACWGGSRVIQVNPKTGQLLKTIMMPTERITSVMFGGDMLETLYVTSMRYGFNESQLAVQPNAGAVFAIYNLGTSGVAANSATLHCPL